MNLSGVRTIVELIRKELAQFRRDRLMMAIIFVAPVVQLIILGLAASFDLQDMPLAIVDHDRSAVSRSLSERFFHGEEFVRIPAPESGSDFETMLDRGVAGAVLVIPRGFSSGIGLERGATGDGAGGSAALSRSSMHLQLIVDGSESVSAALASRAAAQIAGAFTAPGTLAPVTSNIVVQYNPALESRPFFIPGILALVLMIITMLLTSLAIVKEKENGTLEQLIVSPLHSSQILLGKLLPYAGIGLVDMMLVLGVAVLGFGVVPAGSIGLLIGLSTIFILTTLGLGLFVSTVSSTQQEAMMTSMFFIMMPMMFLSGFVFPIANMPEPVQWLTYLLPLRYYFTIIRGIFLRGVGLDVLWPQAAALAVFGVAILSISVLRFHKRLE